jgi:formylglycine-generating enzyme required for sulfatase activity/DNA-binding winged helix-turn-helix (wHTH) protein/dienelactone hydrolase
MALETEAGKLRLDVSRYEVTVGGRRARLERQPMELLILLVQRKGQLVTREDIVKKLWGDAVFVDVDEGINHAIRKIRSALHDHPEHPRYLETVVGKGYRFIGEIELAGATPAPSESSRAGSDSPARRAAPWHHWKLAWITAVGLIALAAVEANDVRRVRWARNQALPEISRLLDQDKTDSAFRLAREAQQYIPNDPLLNRLFRSFTVPVSIHTTPPGADIYVRTYGGTEQDFTYLGRSPRENIQVPWEYLRWRITKPGFGVVEAASSFSSNVELSFRLDETALIPTGMVRVPGGTFQFRSASAVDLGPYWLDKYEVTNRQFRAFVEHGGYQNSAQWKHEFVHEGRRLSWKDAMAEFRDSTGRPGPSGWELGTYPDGQGDFPVGGVSWYEAAAYCESGGKSLPTIYHWYKAAGLGIDSEILRVSNFSGKGPARAGDYPGLSPHGNYDMAGNTKEWAWNQVGEKRYILGGAWNEPSYMFATEDAQAPFSRSATFGFRCAKYDPPVEAPLTSPVQTLARNYKKEKAVPDSIFALYKSLYSYDRTDLDARVESVDDSVGDWRREKVSYRAAYGNERVTAYLFLPRNARPPYAVVIYFPGVSSFFKKSSEDISPEGLSFAVKSGRAVLYPIYMATYERRIRSTAPPATWDEVVQPGSACLPVGPKAGRDLVVQWAKDLARAIDYLETRRDIDAHRLAYYGRSLGAVWGPVFTAVEPRFKASVLTGGGLPFEKLPPEIEPLNFAPRVKVPTLMLNGRDDFMFPLASSQIPLFHLLGASNVEKRHVVFDSGHVPPGNLLVKESLDWLDRYLGPAP